MKILQQYGMVFSLIIFFSFHGKAQGGGLDAEIGFQYVKAEYLFETSRFEECIQEYNMVIAKNPGYKDALVKRAMAKYQLAAYKGAKMDALQSIDVLGITASAAYILGRAENAMGNDEAAINSLSAAIGIDPQTEYYELRATLYEKNGQLLKACEDYQEAASNGSTLGKQKANMMCGGMKTKHTPPVIKPKKQEDTPPVNDQQPVEDPTSEPESGENAGAEETSTTENPTEVVDDPTIPKEDDFAQNVVIDEELSIDIYGQGLGRRAISTTPSILIIADESGSVTLDICVNNLGEVTKAEFNATMSTIAKKSMVNLALRKAKEFVFEKSLYTNQCGYMVFKIKAN